VTAPPHQSRSVSRGSFDHYTLTIRDWDSELRAVLSEVQGTGADLYLRQGAQPTLAQWDARSATSGTSDETVVLNHTTNPVLSSGTWYIGVWHPPGTVYGLDLTRVPLASPIPGFGATVHDGGTTFRVWAPNATAVHVAGTFDGWSPSSAPLAQEPGGVWSVDVRELGPGAQYKYVIGTGAGILWKNDPRARALVHSNGNSIVVDPEAFDWGTAGFSTPAWNDMVVYELHIGTFNDSPGGLPGTFASARLRLPYLAELGVNVVEVMPTCEFPGDFSWGYNPSHPFSVETIYGGVQGFKEFVKAAHENGIAVLLDVLYNHWGPLDLDLWQFDGWNISGWGGIYFYNSVQAQTPWGDTRPDFGRPEVRRYIRDNVLFWLEEYRLDGLRFDSTANIRMGPLGDIPEGWSLLQWLNDEIDAAYPGKIAIAEDLYAAPNEWITKDTSVGGAGFDSQWDAIFVHPVRAALITASDPDRDMWAVRDSIAQSYNGDAFERVIYTESHDEVANGNQRLPEAIWPGNAASYFSKKRSTLGAAVVFTSPGIPMIFQGQEILEDGWFDDQDPVDWTKLVTFAGIHDLYRDLIALRRGFAGTTAGLRGQSTNVFHVDNAWKLIAFHRWDQGGPGDDVVVVLNFKNQAWSGNYTIGLPRPGDWHVRFNSDWDGYDPSFGNHPAPTITAVPGPYDGLPYWADISIGPYTALIFSQ